MKRPVWRPTRSKFAQFSVFSLLIFGAIYGTLLARNFGGANAATAMCYGHAGTHTMVAPSSVTPGQSFKLTNITGTANSSIATVHSVTISLAITNATPTSVSETWSGGPANGDYTSTYGDITLTAGQTAGSQITVRLTAINAQVTIAGVDTSINCSVDNGQLTTNNSGETLNLATINIVAPAASSTPNKSTTKTKTSTSTSSPAPSPTPSPTSGSTTSPSAAPAESTSTAGQDMNVTVQDHSGKPVKNASVYLDSQPAVKTDSHGKATFKLVSAGRHNISVTASGQTITRAIDVGLDPKDVLGIQVRLPAPNRTKQKIFTAIGMAVIGGTGLSIWIMNQRKRQQAVFSGPAGVQEKGPALQPHVTIQPILPPSDDSGPRPPQAPFPKE